MVFYFIIITNSNWLIEMNKNIMDVYILIFYPANLLNYITGFNSLCIDLDFLTITCEKRQFALFIPILKPILCLTVVFLLWLASITNIKNASCTCRHTEPCDIMYWEGHSLISVLFLSKTHNLSPIIRKQQTNSNWGTFNKITDQYLHMCQNHESKRNSGKL